MLITRAGDTSLANGLRWRPAVVEDDGHAKRNVGRAGKGSVVLLASVSVLCICATGEAAHAIVHA
jgi:hypothetical protein